MILGSLFEWGKKELEQAEVPESELNAWYLLQACFEREGVSFARSDFFLRKDEEVLPEIRQQYKQFIEKRKNRVPLEYITGYTEFMGLPFYVDENVLIPRQDTEVLVEMVYPLCDGRKVLDLCTGSGCIGLSIAALGNPSGVVLSDISPDAILVAERNWKQLSARDGVLLTAEVQMVCGSLFEPVEGCFDVIVSNPPYIESGLISGLMPEVSRHEPLEALDGGADGLFFYRKIIQTAAAYLCDDGMLCFEIGYNQGKSVSGYMKENGFVDIEIKKDLAGCDRVVYGRKG